MVDEDIKAKLIEGGMDDRLATHFAHLFIRDPIVVFQEDLEELDLNKTDHFENLQSTNWQHMRFKPPPADNSIGWRVEFRPMEIQVTDFENAAFSVFMVLVTRAILSFDLNFYIPITKVDENMERAHAIDAVLHQRFYFRKDPFPARHTHATRFGGGEGPHANSNGNSNGNGHEGGNRGLNGHSHSASRPGSRTPSRPPTPVGPVEDEYTEMTVNDIINGCTNDTCTFPGLIPLVESYLDSVNVDVQTRCELDAYLRLISMRASGQLVTAARWIRDFVDKHPDYRHDSVVSDAVQKDLVAAVIAVGERELEGKGFANLGIPGLGKLLGGFRGGCGEEK